MKALTVGDLKKYLEAHRLSPEKFAKQVQLSHMTIRRWLKKSDQHPIPEKYYPLLASHLEVNSHSQLDVSAWMDEIEESGKKYTNTDNLEAEVAKKLEEAPNDPSFAWYTKKLLSLVFGSETQTRTRMIAIGALLYFINPIDLIPDHIPLIGYVDDLAVMSLAVSMAVGAEPPRSSRSS